MEAAQIRRGKAQEIIAHKTFDQKNEAFIQLNNIPSSHSHIDLFILVKSTICDAKRGEVVKMGAEAPAEIVSEIVPSSQMRILPQSMEVLPNDEASMMLVTAMHPSQMSSSIIGMEPQLTTVY